jgi:hypothetical protein
LINSINSTTVNVKSESNDEGFEQETETKKPVDHTNIFHLNVGGEIIVTTRQTLTKIPPSTVSILFNGLWENELPKDKKGNIFLDFNPILFRHLLDQLQIIETNNTIELYPPFQPSLVEPFNKMIRKLGVQQSLLSKKRMSLHLMLVDKRLQINEQHLLKYRTPLSTQSFHQLK